eukprot:5392783-Prymnesium_polylepis.1
MAPHVKAFVGSSNHAQPTQQRLNAVDDTMPVSANAEVWIGSRSECACQGRRVALGDDLGQAHV